MENEVIRWLAVSSIESRCGKAAGAGLRAGAEAVTPGAVRCSACLCVAFMVDLRSILFGGFVTSGTRNIIP